MKKLIAFFVIVVIIVIVVFYFYLKYQDTYYTIQRENLQFESYYEQETYGNEIATLINKAVDNNTKNKVEKDNKGKYIENDTNSITIDIKMIDNDKTYDMEDIYNGGIPTFTSYYDQIKFKCTKMEYHSKTGRVKYLLFEQTTQ